MDRKIVLGALSVLATSLAYCQSTQQAPLNVLLITADDLNYNSVGYMGCEIQNVSPNLDKLASQGMIFNNAYVNIAVSQPSRAVLATGMYSHNNGVEGFNHTTKDISTIMSVLGSNGYRTGIAGKYAHATPIESYKWDMELDQKDLGQGRDPKLYYDAFKSFVQESKKQGKPFYFMANSHDPHAPFHGSANEKRQFPNKTFPDASYVFKDSEMVVPDFLVDLPQTRIELAQYYSSVRRLDDMVGEILRVLQEEGIADNTIVMFLSDNGMDFPFAKTNCYMNSNKTPWVVKWPGVVKPNSVDSEHYISGIDFLPTILEACDIEFNDKIDGCSFVPVLKGKKQKDRTQVFTQFYQTSGNNSFPMFAIHDKDFVYIYSPWSNGERVFVNCSWAGITFAAMNKYEGSDPAVLERLNFFKTRTREELYDAKRDPDALNNLANDAKYAQKVENYRAKMLEWMNQTGSWATHLMNNIDNIEACDEHVNNKTAELKANHKAAVAKKKQQQAK